MDLLLASLFRHSAQEEQYDLIGQLLDGHIEIQVFADMHGNVVPICSSGSDWSRKAAYCR